MVVFSGISTKADEGKEITKKKGRNIKRKKDEVF